MKKEKKQEYYLTTFTMYNEKLDTYSFIKDKIWLKNYDYFRKLVKTMDWTNKINFDSLLVSDITIKRLRSKLHKYWFIRKCNIDDDIWYDWYLNPYLYNKDNKVNPKLKEIFLTNEKLPKQVSSEEVKKLINILF